MAEPITTQGMGGQRAMAKPITAKGMGGQNYANKYGRLK